MIIGRRWPRLGACTGYCEGDHCCDPQGEVRVYPILSVSRAARVILCRPCWEHENRYRHERGEERGCPKHWPKRDWDAAERSPTRAPVRRNYGNCGPTIRPPCKEKRRKRNGGTASLAA